MSDKPLSGQDQLKPLADLWMHQNNLMWNRINLLSALQGSALVANYVLRNPFSSLGILLLAIAATLYLNYFWEVDRVIRNSYSDRLEKFGFKISLPPEERRDIYVKIIGIAIRAHLGSRNSLTYVFWGMIAVDLVVLFISVAIFSGSN